ncbi:replicative DNA helicase [Marinactinospora rubrisoli]|uniref:Replicative DNA helicase n=1 Tax=Marinactinospora rubrisoli TaxID=2715399 RepID=A0ABW2KQ05_9ACTN
MTDTDTTSWTRTPPQDLQAEQAALGGMLLSPLVAADVMAIMRVEDLYRPAHQTIYTAISDLLARGEPVDAVSVNAELARRGESARTGGAPYLHTLTEAVPTAANAGYYAKLVADQALLRRLVEAGTRAVQIGYSGDGDALDLVDRAQAEMMGITERAAGPTSPLIGEVMPGVVDRMQEMAGAEDGLIGISTGFSDLDSLTRGLWPGQLIVIGGRPSLGKSTLAMDFARTAAIRDQVPTAFFSLEMGTDELAHRILSAESKVPLHRVKAGDLTEADWQVVSRALPRINAAPLVLEDRAATTLADIRSTCRRLKRSMGLRLVVVDYLQIVTPAGRRDTRQEEVSQMSRELKLLAKELGITVVALSQLNRGPEQRPDKKPQIADLRESGAVEQDADVVILLHREDAYDKDSVRAGEGDLIVAKHRNGPTATVTVAFQGHYSRFVDMAAG